MSIRKIVDLLSLTLLIASPVALGVVSAQTSTPAVHPQPIEDINFPLNKAQVINFEPHQGFKNLTERQKLDQLRDWLLMTVLYGKGLNSKTIIDSIYDMQPVRYDFMSPVVNLEYGTTRSRYIGDGKVVAIVPKTNSKEERINNLAYIADSLRKNQGEKPKVIEVFEYEIHPNNQLATITRRNSINGEEIFSSAYGYYETPINSKNDLQDFLNQVDDITFGQNNDNSLTLGGRKIYGAKHQNIHLEDIATLWQAEKKIDTRLAEFRQRLEKKLRDLPPSKLDKEVLDKEVQEAYAKEHKQGLVNGSGFSLDREYNYSSLEKALDNVIPLLQYFKVDSQPLISKQEIQKVKQELQQAKAGVSENGIPKYLQLVDKIRKFRDTPEYSKILEKGEFEEKINQEMQSEENRLRRLEEINEINQYEQKFRAQISVKLIEAKKAGKTNEEINSINKNLTREKNDKLHQIAKGIKIKKYIEWQDISKAKANQKLSPLNNFLETDRTQSFQYARYDGDLQGTEVGMNLFYTDFLAKAWGFDYANSAPEKPIQDFKALKNITVSPIYKEELNKVSATRTWFEPNTKEFQVAGAGKNLLFSRIATKVSALSHNPNEGETHEEAPNAFNDAFVNFWNAHYEEVAEFEPQYKKLNAIMKWSLLISWMNHSGHSHLLNFLKDVRVKRDWNFPDWVQAHKSQLRFQDWATQPCNKQLETTIEQPETTIEKPVCFYKPGDKKTKAEAMPVLVSKSFPMFGKQYYLYGGVALSPKNLFDELPSLNKETPLSEVSLRPNIEPNSVEGGTNSLTFRSRPIAKNFLKNGNNSQGTTYRFKYTNSSEAESTIIPEKSLIFRSTNAKLINQKITNKIVQTAEGIKIENDIGNTESIKLNISKKTGNGFDVGFFSRGMESDYSLGLLVSQDPRPIPEVLKENKGVEAVIESPTHPKEYIVKRFNSDKDLIINEQPKAGGGGNSPPPRTPEMLVSDDSGKNSREIGLFWRDRKQFAKEKVAGKEEFYPKPSLEGEGEPPTEINYKEEAEKILQDPQGFIAHKNQLLKDEITKVDNLWKAGEDTKALKLIDELIDVYGADTNLSLRKIKIKIRQDKLRFEQVFPEGSLQSQRKQTVLDEITKQLKKNPLNVNRVENDTQIIYGPKSSKFNNLDPHVPIEQSIPSGSGIKAYKLIPEDIGKTKLYMSGLGDTSASSHASTEFRGKNPAQALRNITIVAAVTGIILSSDDQEKPIYVVITDDQK